MVAVLIPVFKAKAIKAIMAVKVVIINSLVMGINISNLVIKVIRNSRIVGSTTSSPRVYASGIRSSVKEL